MKAMPRFTMATFFCLSMTAAVSSGFADNIHTCVTPSYNGNRLDWCLNPSKDCGKPAADEFCKRLGGDEALEDAQHPLAYDYNLGKTIIIGTGRSKICTSPPYDHCDGFKSITCRKWDTTPWPWNAQSEKLCPKLRLHVPSPNLNGTN